MNIIEILTIARSTWGDKPMQLPHIAAALNTVAGDVSRHARNQIEGEQLDETALKTELGNLISSTIRWCDDLGFNPEECVRLSQAAQERYAKTHPPKW